ncbi:MAG: protein disulfide isomerase (PDI) protein [Bathelium mastoideum]|nr:MAG: protein disulfide isomerase (PDI) protein [Bathelium mastoideum]KAI9692858.1 MAG: protein disulfide isomerase (PDI) protein [Bathelium mastoideum]
MTKAIHFGGGNIGRGFVAEFLSNSGYEVVFIDVVDALIDTLQKTPSYTVTEIGPDGESKFEISNFRAINSKHNEPQVVEEIATADVVTCAVGPNILKFIAPVIAKGIEKRTASKPLAVIACENAIGGTDTLMGFVKDKLSEETKADLKSKVRAGNSAIDRIVPKQDEGAGMNVKIEKFYEWCVEEKPFEGVGTPPIKGVHFVSDLEPYIERKLFTVNTSHATAAYFGHARGKTYIHEAMEDKEIHDIVQEAIAETAHLIVNKHGITAADQKKYCNEIIDRISNPMLEDVVERVGRAPLRKLGRKERFVGPASQLAERGEKVDGLLAGIEQAFRFQNVEGDEESKELAQILSANDAKTVVTKVCGLEESHPLYSKIVPIVEKVQKEKA